MLKSICFEVTRPLTAVRVIRPPARVPWAQIWDKRMTAAMSTASGGQGDLNNNSVLRKPVQEFLPDPVFAHRSLAIPEKRDDSETREVYRPFLLQQSVEENDWVSRLELSTAAKMASSDLERTGERLKILVLYGSMRGRSYSQLMSYEASRILWRLGCDVRVYNPSGLPLKDDVQHDHPKVQELRELSKWSDGHVWICPEQHGTIVRCFEPHPGSLLLERAILMFT